MNRQKALSPRKFNDLTVKFLFLPCVFFCLPFARTAAGQNPSEFVILRLNDPLTREIAVGEKHSYRLALPDKQYAKIVVEQRGADVALRLLGTDAKAVAQSDLTLKTEGREMIAFVALEAGDYRLEIESKPNSPAGRYTVSLAEERTSSEKERRLEEARRFHNEAIAFYGAGKYDEALTGAERALEIREKEAGAEDLSVADSLASLALIVDERGDYERAVRLNRRALAIREKLLGTYHQDVARTLHNLARTLTTIDNIDEAIRLYEKAIEVREKVLGSESVELATSLNNLGLIYENSGDYAKAEQLMRRSLEIKEKKLPPNSPSIAFSFSALAGLYSVKGDEDKAVELYRRALEIREKAFGPEHPDVARSLDYLATSYLTKGDYRQAEANYLRALQILRKTLGTEHYRTARTLGNLAVLYHQQADYRKAEPLFIETVEIMGRTLGTEHRDYATALNNLAEFYTDKGDYQKAEPLFEKALSIAERNLGPQHPDAIFYLNNLARNYQAKNETAKAVEMWSRARRISERNMQAVLLISAERQKLLYLDSLASETNQYISAHTRFAPDSPAALDLALTTIFERKGRVSDAMALGFAALRSRFNQSDQILLDKLKDVTSKLSQKILSGPEDAPGEHQEQIGRLEEEKERIEAEISRRSAEFRSQMRTVTIPAIRSAIPENAALVEFGLYRPFDPKAADDAKAYGEPHYAAYVVRRRGDIRWKDLGPAKPIDEAVTSFRRALRDPKQKDFRLLGRAVDEKLTEPVRALAGDAVHLLVSPDGELNLIPFEALVDEQNRFLIERYAFTYLTGGRDLLRIQTPRESKNKALVIANPFFGEPGATIAANTGKANPRRGAKRRSVTATRNLSETYFAPLGGTAQEARAIQTLFPESEVLTEAQATESALKKINAPRLLHIATHGFFLEDGRLSKNTTPGTENPLLRSGLAFAGANRHAEKADQDDGILTALEASGLNLWGTKLVVLSACDTGLGEVKNGEGVYGLRRAFTLAGTESLVMSLWSVSDYVTRELMTGFYKNLKAGMRRDEALRQVQLEMLKKPSRRHPFYWASFIQSGEWANLDGRR